MYRNTSELEDFSVQIRARKWIGSIQEFIGLLIKNNSIVLLIVSGLFNQVKKVYL